MGYEFPPEIQQAITAEKNNPEILSLKGEVGLLRVLLAREGEKNPRLAIEISNTLAKLVRTIAAEEIRAEHWLPKSEMYRTVQRLGGIIADRLQHIEGWELILEDIATDFNAVIFDIDNQPPSKQIEG